MINGKKVLAVVPARGGSKSLPGKNIKLLGGKPLVQWTIDEALNSKYIDRIILSSDDEVIIRTAKSLNGCDIPFVRPKELARDNSPGTDVILHALNEIPGYDLVVQLQPTSPLRKAKDIDRCIEISTSGRTDSCVSVSKASKSPFWMYTVGDSGKMSPILPKPDGFYSRQTLPRTYSLNGAVYAAGIGWFKKQKSFISPDTHAYLMPESRSIDIDTELDFKICELLLSK